VKFSLQLNLQDEVVRSSLVSLVFAISSKIEYSFQDYEHLLGEKKQLIGVSDNN